MTEFEVIQGTPYSCQSDTNILSGKKMALDYHSKNIGNPAKSTITPEKLKLLEIDYEVAKKKYDASPCGKNPETENCIALQARIVSLRSSITYFLNTKDFQGAENLKKQLDSLNKEFEDSKCGDKVSAFRADVIDKITDAYSEMDKKRIEEESKYRAKQRIFYGGLVVLGAVLIVTMFGKKD